MSEHKPGPESASLSEQAQRPFRLAAAASALTGQPRPESEFVFIYVTTGSLDEARRIGEELITRRLAACTNILPGMESQYVWNGQLTSSQEAVLIIKTRSALAEAVSVALTELHSYDVPCILCWPVDSLSEPYSQWLRTSLDAARDVPPS